MPHYSGALHKGMRLNDYSAEMEKEALSRQAVSTPFGLSGEGNFIDTWRMNYDRIEIYTRNYGISMLGPGGVIRIYVPRTDSGVEPLTADEQPYGWDGKINEESAERAVWWAFELMTKKRRRSSSGSTGPR